ncbi:MAG TPA: histidine kinase, partial [Ghiorsea sp.]|nr:histidine kinase [Ghiorsea sp.]
MGSGKLFPKKTRHETRAMKPSDIFAAATISPWRILTYTLLFCLFLPMLFALLGDDDPFLHNLIFSLCIGLLAQLFATVSVKLLKNHNTWIQWIALIDSILLATPLGSRLAFWLTGADRDMPDDLLYMSVVSSLPLGIFFGGIILWVFYARAKATKIKADRLQLELSNEIKEKQLSQAQLNLLQAQIEPHFLFNTLATVHSLIEEAPKQASTMLERVNDYLRAALDHSRSKACLLSDEIDLLQAYLDIMKMRMGERLHFDMMID